MEEENISQVKIEEVFIKSLLDKLKVGNRRGIHLNAIPGRARSRLDLAELDEIRDGLSKEFLDKLLNEESFEFAINFEGINFTEIEEKQKEKLDFIARKLNNISIDDEDQYLESGIRNFGFGYPLLIRRDQTDPEKVVKAPLLIWNLDIEKSNRKQSHWTVKKNPERCAHINQLLRSHVLRDSQISIDALDAEYLDDNVVDESELFEICEKILSQINTQSSSIDIKGLRVEKCPTGNKLDGLATDEAWIQWSGVFGIFTSQKESVIRQAEKMLKELPAFQDQKLVLDKFQTSTVSSVATDPSKEEIINTLTDNEVKLIQGPPGTGKSQALTAIITNVLENGGKCLVVCEKRTALQVIHRNLSKLKLDNMCALIDDVSKDRTTIVKKREVWSKTPRITEQAFYTVRRKTTKINFRSFAGYVTPSIENTLMREMRRLMRSHGKIALENSCMHQMRSHGMESRTIFQRNLFWQMRNILNLRLSLRTHRMRM